MLRTKVEGVWQGSIESPLVIGWVRHDRVCFPSQTRRAVALFRDVRLHWFEHCGHFTQWDSPQATLRLILANTGKSACCGLSQERPMGRQMRRRRTEEWAVQRGLRLLDEFYGIFLTP